MTMLDTIWAPNVQQSVYRNLLRAVSYPGHVADLGVERAWVSVLATLCDDAASLADLGALLDQRTREFLRAPAAPVETATFVLLRAADAPDESFEPRIGDLENPEFGATLVLVGESVGGGPLRLQLTGPGVNGGAELVVGGFHPGWFRRREQWVDRFPLGVDLFLCDAHRVAALPRTTVVKLEV